jgi:hypothetical protein
MWEVTNVAAFSGLRDELLAQGWEPFAVVDTGSAQIMWLRRKKK